MGSGGKRPGAGRKPIADTPRVTISARVAKKTKDRIDELREKGIPTGKLIDDLIDCFRFGE